MVVVFEGRESAGKGGVIKRITQRLNPRVVARRPAPPRRERAVFPALCAAFPPPGLLFDRLVQSRGVERVMGLPIRSKSSSARARV